MSLTTNGCQLAGKIGARLQFPCNFPPFRLNLYIALASFAKISALTMAANQNCQIQILQIRLSTIKILLN